MIGLGTVFSPRFFRISTSNPNFYMELRRSQRQPKPKTMWEEKGAAKDPKITKKNDRTEQKTALKPIAFGPVPEALEFASVVVLHP